MPQLPWVADRGRVGRNAGAGASLRVRGLPDRGDSSHPKRPDLSLGSTALNAYLHDMHIQINTDKNIEGGEALAEHVRSVVEKTLKHHADQISRVEVHLRDVNAEKTGAQDHTCTMEARPKGMEPVAATYKAANNHAAVEGAATSLANLLRTRFGKLHDQKGKAALPFQGEQV